ncbi:MAG: acyl-CoA thioesterase, partial [Firmicutes bacterium]|nr:acyl-CoA thioesterase [Bacillota bacterium]
MAYRHKVQYYETDKMGVTHHSNYIRWMEEARIDYMNQLGYGYDEVEEGGIMSPVLSVECEYKSATTFPEEVDIEVWVEELKGVRFQLVYEMKKTSDGEVCCTGMTKHCIIDESGK